MIPMMAVDETATDTPTAELDTEIMTDENTTATVTMTDKNTIATATMTAEIVTLIAKVAEMRSTVPTIANTRRMIAGDLASDETMRRIANTLIVLLAAHPSRLSGEG